MSQEVELKMRLSPAQAGRLPSHPALAATTPQKFRLLNTYFDTPDLALRQHGIALRLRRKGWDWLMTVKGGNPGSQSAPGGLARRNEWEARTQPGEFDFGIVTDDDLREFLEAQRPRLEPLFTTDFTRFAWTINQPGASIELALDRGHIAARGNADAKHPTRLPLCEIELELINGDSVDALFDLAIELATDLRLHPEAASKAERGYTLASAEAARPDKAVASPVRPEMSPVEAFRAVALACVLHLQRNEAGAIAGENPEYVHQARVAIRRLRSALRLFAPVLPATFIEIYSPRWRDVASSLGGARDWDVFLEETLAPLESAFPEDADLARVRQRGEAIAARAKGSAGSALNRPEYSQLLLAFTAALFRLEPPPIEARKSRRPPGLRKFARRRLQKRALQVEQLAGEHGRMNATRRHEMRIAFKKLRYALEFFTPLLPPKRVRAYQCSLAHIQDLLGQLNDLATATRLIKELHPKDEPSLTRGWLAGRSALLIDSLTPALRDFIAARKPWR